MPVNSTHTTRIAELESKVQELEKEHALYFANCQKLLIDSNDNKTLLNSMQHFMDNLYTNLETVQVRLDAHKAVIEGLSIYQTTNEKNVTLLFDRMDNSINILTDLHNRLNHVERETQPSKKNTKSTSIAQLVKVLLYIPFTTLKG
jgi:uncharacterized radical SAM superfamily Fe-S cluster-containing enzyme